MAIAQEPTAPESGPLDLTFTVNGTTVNATVDPKKTLLRYLRDDLGLMGTKDGCTSGDCGSCVVQVDGKTVDSCVYLMRRADADMLRLHERQSALEAELAAAQGDHVALARVGEDLSAGAGELAAVEESWLALAEEAEGQGLTT